MDESEEDQQPQGQHKCEVDDLQILAFDANSGFAIAVCLVCGQEHQIPTQLILN